ncbi:MAG: polysaccharide biosynthesis protein [Clostridia bacterium]|nr:polysaccharide biosynthesis protein [Clostridia bacterium]
MTERKNHNFVTGAAVLTATVAVTKVLGLLYKVPLFNILGDEGTAHFSVTYAIYNLLLSISTAGIPVAISRLISSSAALGRDRQVRRIFRSALIPFSAIGALCALIMVAFPQLLADFMGDGEITLAIRVLGPAVLLCCIIAVFRGYFQGLGDMVPTAISQVTEVLGKLLIGLPAAWLLFRRGFGTPVVTAGAISGVTAGLLIVVPILLRYKRRADVSVQPKSDPTLPDSVGKTVRTILAVSVPITIGASLMNIINLIDTKLILLRLQAGAGFSYETAKVLYGVFGKAQTLFNLPAAFIVPITVSAVPAIAAAVAERNGRESKLVMESALKLGNLIAMPAGIGLTVLAFPIFNVLYWGSDPNGPVLLAIMGVASYLVCTQLTTTAVLQANGFEKFTVLTLPVGGAVKILITWFAVGSPSVNILGGPVGTLACYGVISLLNIGYILLKVPNRPSFKKAFLAPFFCAAVMGVGAWASYSVISKLLSGALGMGHMAMALYMCAAVLTAVVIYGVLIIATGAVSREDMRFVKGGERIARALHLK